MRTAHIAALSLLTVGCLSNPDPQGASNNAATNNAATNNAATNNAATNGAATNNAATNNAATNNASSTGGSEEAVCDNCREDDTSCDDDKFLRCEPTEGGACTRWVEHAVCVGDQVCIEGVGCGCDDECELGEVTCADSGASTCLWINGCAREVAIGRSSTCQLPASPSGLPCTPDSDYPWCQECENGRSCVQVCENPTGYSCGSPDE